LAGDAFFISLHFDWIDLLLLDNWDVGAGLGLGLLFLFLLTHDASTKDGRR